MTLLKMLKREITDDFYGTVMYGKAVYGKENGDPVQALA